MIKLKKGLLVAIFSTICLLSQSVFATGSLTVKKEVEINAAPDTVWKMIGGFNNLDVWHPVVVNSTMQGNGMKAGDVRVLTLGNGAKITEKLVVHNDNKKNYTYAIIDSPLPVQNYVSTISVFSKADGVSVVEWKSTFDAKDAPDEKAVESISGVYDAGLNNLVKDFNQ